MKNFRSTDFTTIFTKFKDKDQPQLRGGEPNNTYQYYVSIG